MSGIFSRGLFVVGFVLVVAFFVRDFAGQPATATGPDGASVAEMIAAEGLIVDVRTPEEFAGGAYEGAVNIPHDQVDARIDEFGTDKSKPIVLYCRSGGRAGKAEKVLKSHGFTNVVNAGGLKDMPSH